MFRELLNMKPVYAAIEIYGMEPIYAYIIKTKPIGVYLGILFLVIFIVKLIRIKDRYRLKKQAFIYITIIGLLFFIGDIITFVYRIFENAKGVIS